MEKHYLQVIMAGDQGVGKTSISQSFKLGSNQGNDRVTTIGFEIFTKTVIIDEEGFKICIKDASGDNRFMTVTKQYLREGDGVVLVYDVSDRLSFENIINWHQKIGDVRGESFGLTIIANKVDLVQEREVSFEEGKELAERLKGLYIETSGYNYVTVEEAMIMTFRNIYSEKIRERFKNRNSFSLNKSKIIDKSTSNRWGG